MAGDGADSRNLDERIMPIALAASWIHVLEVVPDAAERHDRRGFRLLHWPPDVDGKPNELSLEHELRLKPVEHEEASASLLATDLLLHHERNLGQLLPGLPPELRALVVRQKDRPPGPQSLDLYWDTDGRQSLIDGRATVRERLMTSPFMSWGGADAGTHTCNLELPAVYLHPGLGLLARLEFNWLDPDGPPYSVTGPDEWPASHPMRMAAEITGLPFTPLQPSIRHATTRLKFDLVNAEGRDELALNIDLVRTSRASDAKREDEMESYIDVDIAPACPVGERELTQLIALGESLTKRYCLVGNSETKALRDKHLLDEPS